MYRCYLVHHGRIAKAEDLAASTLDEAIAQGRTLLNACPETTAASGIEIWQQGDRLYSDQCHAGDTGMPADVVSPFATPDSTMLPTWRPSYARLVSKVTPGRKL